MYYLLHVYGPVPLIVDPNDLINPSKLENLVRPTLQQMTEWIMADFDYAYQYMQIHSQNRDVTIKTMHVYASCGIA